MGIYKHGVTPSSRRAEAQERTRLEEIARGNIEQHLADVAEEGEESEDNVYDQAYTLGFDALVDAGVDHRLAREVAQSVAQCFAQP